MGHSVRGGGSGVKPGSNVSRGCEAVVDGRENDIRGGQKGVVCSRAHIFLIIYVLCTSEQQQQSILAVRKTRSCDEVVSACCFRSHQVHSNAIPDQILEQPDSEPIDILMVRICVFSEPNGVKVVLYFDGAHARTLPCHLKRQGGKDTLYYVFKSEPHPSTYGCNEGTKVQPQAIHIIILVEHSELTIVVGSVRHTSKRIQTYWRVLKRPPFHAFITGHNDLRSVFFLQNARKSRV